MKSITLIISFLFWSIISCKTKEERMKDFFKCSYNQVGKPYVSYDAQGPDKFSNSYLVRWIKLFNLYIKKTKPKFVAHVFGVIKDSGA